ncbi:hypothetical protein QYE76_017143 [Lolium multiflorum]|uniref:CCHC-type domain-containing protein n=1 Tax=Lolium multiflorum TaxID=4521 RepID=A0AAD8QG90_LOLMU|nr:hypothetical protein QYE76_017143 [Lolium multiflorum]
MAPTSSYAYGLRCYKCKQQGHLPRECPNLLCEVCKAKGHVAWQCTTPSAKKLYFDELNAQVSKMPPLEDDLGGDGVEHGEHGILPSDTSSPRPTSPPSGPMTRARAKAIHDKVNSLLTTLDLGTPLDGLLPHADVLCVIRYKAHQDPGEDETPWSREGEEQQEPGDEHGAEADVARRAPRKKRTLAGHRPGQTGPTTGRPGHRPGQPGANRTNSLVPDDDRTQDRTLRRIPAYKATQVEKVQVGGSNPTNPVWGRSDRAVDRVVRSLVRSTGRKPETSQIPSGWLPVRGLGAPGLWPGLTGLCAGLSGLWPGLTGLCARLPGLWPGLTGRASSSLLFFLFLLLFFHAPWGFLLSWSLSTSAPIDIMMIGMR